MGWEVGMERKELMDLTSEIRQELKWQIKATQAQESPSDRHLGVLVKHEQIPWLLCNSRHVWSQYYAMNFIISVINCQFMICYCTLAELRRLRSRSRPCLGFCSLGLSPGESNRKKKFWFRIMSWEYKKKVIRFGKWWKHETQNVRKNEKWSSYHILYVSKSLH